MYYNIVERKNSVVAFKNKELKKTKNWFVFKGVSPWFWSKIGHFFISFFLGNLDQENVFYDILKQKTPPFYAIKTKSRKIEFFPKGLVNGFGPQLAICEFFFF